MDVNCFSEKKSNENLFCFVDGCFTTSARNKYLGFHQFPGNDKKWILKKYRDGTEKLVNRRQLWIQALNIDKEATTVIGKMRVCSLHFSKKDFEKLIGKRGPYYRLKKSAIPRRNLPLRRTSKLTTKFQCRSFYRIKWRGRLAFQDPDRRVPFSRNLREPEMDSGHRTVVDIQVERNKKTLRIAEVSSNADLSGFTLDTSDPETTPEKSRKVQDTDDEVQCTSTNQITSELIIKEEPLSDNEEDLENWEDEEEEEDVTVYGTDKTEELQEEEEGDSRQKGDEITTEKVLEDLESSQEEDDAYGGDDEGADEVEKRSSKVWRDRPCKVCGKKDCAGHPTDRPIENLFACLVCSEVFPTPGQLDAHSVKHDDEMNGGGDFIEDYVYRGVGQYKELTCHICGKVLATKVTLKEHMLIHTGEKPHVCLLCGRAFRHKANLVVHINAHTIVRTFECPMCPMKFSMRADLEDHKRTHADQEHACNVCGDAFHSKRALWTHQQVHNRRTQRKKKRGMKKGGLPCRVCGKLLSTKNTLKEHMMIHSGEKPHECLLCGKMIRHKANFIIHVQSHGASEMYPCDMCEYSFQRKVDLKAHKQEAHKPFTCMLCGMSFRNEDGLMNHVEESHGDSAGKKAGSEYDNLFQPHLLAGFGTTDR